MKPSGLREKLNEMKTRRAVLAERLEEDRDRLAELEQATEDIQKARALIQEAALRTQDTLRIRLTAVGSTALNAVFQDPEDDMEFQATFKTSRGRTECALEVVDHGVAMDPMECKGGGVVDVLSFALRVSFWSMRRSRPVLILDEPFKNLRGAGMQAAAVDMMRTVAKRLGLQIIMVTHEQEFIDGADNVVHIVKKGIRSKVAL